MPVHVKKLERIEGSVGTMRLVESELLGYFSLMRAGNVDSYLGHVTEQELRDAHELFGDVIAYIDSQNHVDTTLDAVTS